MIDEDISKAETLPAKFYREQSYFDAARESIFKHSWQFLGDSDCLSAPGAVKALSLLPGYLDEPLILSKDTEDNLNCLSNVCTHRGNLLVGSDCHAQNLRCRYHGRRFGLDGRMLSAPGFENAQCFPTERDNLSKLPFAQWGNLSHYPHHHLISERTLPLTTTSSFQT